MPIRIVSNRIMLSALLLAAPCLAQQSSQTPAQQNPAPPAQQGSSSSSQQQAAPQHKHTTADDNPFPEDESKKAAQGDDSSASPSAPSDAKPAAPDYSSSRSGLDKLKDDSSDESRITDGAGGYIHDPKMAIDDVKVGSFYMQRGDFKGAYNRFLEATKVDPDNADAVFELAEAAKGLNRKQEAIDNYQVYLAALPNGSKAKAAHKALSELNAKK